MKKMEVKTMPIADLTPAPYNPRSISEAALKGLRGSVERFGMVEPVVWNKQTGNIVGGHQRVKVLHAMGETSTMVVVVDIPEIEEKALNVVLNNPHIAGEFTENVNAILAEIAQELPEIMGLLQLDKLGEVTGLLNPDPEGADPDDVPEEPEVPVTQPGDLYIMGNHRLICGDSGDPEVLTRLMDGKVASLYATDPPYGVGYDGTSHPQNKRDKDQGREPGSQNRDWSEEYWDHYESAEAFQQFLERIFLNAKQHVAKNAAWYCWHASVTTEQFLAAWRAAGIRYHQTITWVKPTHVLGFLMWNYRTEPCLMGWQQGNKPEAIQVPEEHSNCWEVDWEGKARCTDNQHPTQKPVRLFELPMLKHTRPGDICLETFTGSGSQVIAVERMPVFCDVIVKRWENMTGKKAVRYDAV